MSHAPLLLLLMAVFAAHRAYAAFPVVDSGSWVLSSGSEVAYWIDNNQLIFIGDAELKPQSEREGILSIVRWEIGKQPTVVRRGVDTLCYHAGQVGYYARDPGGGTRVLHEGELGRETRSQFIGMDWMSCRGSPRPEKAQRRTRALLPGHGFLDLGPNLGPEAFNGAPVVHHPEGATPRPLPFGRNEYHPPSYYEFKRAYFFNLSYVDPARGYATNVFPAGTAKVAYWLWPDGRTEKVEIPRDIEGAQPSRAGLLFRILQNRKDYELHLLTPSGQRKVVAKGYVTGRLAVSPDGCRVAFAHAPDERTNNWRPQNRRTLKVAELCAK